MAVYFAQLSTGAIKIGCSNNVEKRLDMLHYYYGDELVLLHTMDGDWQTEREIHERFAHLRFGRTEQFKPADDLMAFIGRPLLASANPDAIEMVPGKFKKAIAFRVTEDFGRWLEGYAIFKRMTISDLMDRALAEMAERDGYKKPPVRA